MKLRVLVALGCLAGTAHADDHITAHHVDRPSDGLVIGSALGVAFAASLIPMRSHDLWDHELFGDADASVHDQFSRRAKTISDVMIGVDVAAPALYLAGTSIDDAYGDRMLIYGEALAVDIALFEAVKHVVQRPRPYTYSRDPDIVAYAAKQGDDAYQSFYSAHSATAFCAATAGAYLVATSTNNETLRAVTWGAGFAAATATANLRVRAGRHFYSDVLVGGAVGIAIGYAVPALHATGSPYVPSAVDLVAAGGGVLAGFLSSELLPLESSVHVTPVAVKDGAGFGIAGAF